jgi:hypothetical protein
MIDDKVIALQIVCPATYSEKTIVNVWAVIQSLFPTANPGARTLLNHAKGRLSSAVIYAQGSATASTWANSIKTLFPDLEIKTYASNGLVTKFDGSQWEDAKKRAGEILRETLSASQ